MEIGTLKRQLEDAKGDWHAERDLVAAAIIEIPLGKLYERREHLLKILRVVGRSMFAQSLSRVFAELDKMPFTFEKGTDAAVLHFIDQHYGLLEQYSRWNADLDSRFSHWLYKCHAGSHTRDHTVY